MSQIEKSNGIAKHAIALVIGASSEIAKAIIGRLMDDPEIDHVVAISRQPQPDKSVQANTGISFLNSDYSEQSIADILLKLAPEKGSIAKVFICNGILHDQNLRPEKRLEDIKANNLKQVFEVNAVVPMLWVKHLKEPLSGKFNSVVTVFSARIGSIEDNKLGGWYAYRASKAALNMLIKTSAIEFARVAKGVQFLVFHPGTTDTPLSKPFQKSVSAEKLFTPDFVAERLLKLVDERPEQGNIRYLDWDGKDIAW